MVGPRGGDVALVCPTRVGVVTPRWGVLRVGVVTPRWGVLRVGVVTPR